MSDDYCRWTEDADGAWITDCGKVFEFNEGTPTENRARFCLYCGDPLFEVRREEEPEEDK